MDLSEIPIIDQHAHCILRPDAPFEYASAFTEADDADLARTTVFFRRSLREIAALLDCDPSEQAIVERRKQMGYEEVARRSFAAAGLEAALIDDGFLTDQAQPIEWHHQFVPARRLLRLESLAEQLVSAATNFDEFLERFRAAIDPPPTNVVGFKSIAAYRSGLMIEEPPLAVVREHFANWKQNGQRLMHKPIIDYLLREGLAVACRHGLPLQLHSGFGDRDLDLRLANPLHLQPLLEETRLRDINIVLLHASYPYTREAGWLASVYPRVFLDCGLAIPFLSRAGMRATVMHLMELAPASKIMYSSDASRIPELYYLATRWGRRVLAEVLQQSVREGDLNVAEAEQTATAVLHENARRLYHLPEVI